MRERFLEAADSIAEDFLAYFDSKRQQSSTDVPD
jgi:hypothetical protein